MTAAAVAATTTTNKPPPSAVSAFISAANTKSPREALAFEILHNLRYQHRWSDLKVHSISHPSPSSSASPQSQSQEPPNSTNRTQSPTRSPDHPTAQPYNRTKSPSSQHNSTLFLISGLPPRTLYIHPDLQKRLVRDGLDESAPQPQREWVLPMSVGEKWTLKRFCLVFDALPEREAVRVQVHGHGKVDVVSQNAGPELDDDIGSAHQPADGTAGSDFTWQDRKRVLLAMLAHNGLGGDGTVAYYIMQEGEVKPRQNG